MEPTLKPNCPFYGRHLVPGHIFTGGPFTLLDQRGNEYALATHSFSPCQMEVEGAPIDWLVCPRVAAIRPSWGAMPEGA